MIIIKIQLLLVLNDELGDYLLFIPAGIHGFL